MSIRLFLNIIVFSVLVYGCGGGDDMPFLPPYNISIPVEPGLYNVVMRRTSGDCEYLPTYEKDRWVFYVHDDVYMVNVQGVLIRSDDGMYFVGDLYIGGICNTNAHVLAYVRKTIAGFEGRVKLNIDSGICDKCTDFADIDGTAITD